MKALAIENVREYYDRMAEAADNFGVDFVDTGITEDLDTAMDRLEQYRPEVVFLDHNLSDEGGEGLPLAQWIQENLPETVIISVTDAANHGLSNARRLYTDNGVSVKFFAGKDPELLWKALLRAVVLIEQCEIQALDEQPVKIMTAHDEYGFYANMGQSLKADYIEVLSWDQARLADVRAIVFGATTKDKRDECYHMRGELSETVDVVLDLLVDLGLASRVKVVFDYLQDDLLLEDQLGDFRPIDNELCFGWELEENSIRKFKSYLLSGK